MKLNLRMIVNNVTEAVRAYFKEGSGICLEELGKMTAYLGQLLSKLRTESKTLLI
jgi:hypothetical protein